MADEDEIDVLGEFDLETLFTKEDERLICYDGMDIPSQWLLDTTAQPCWYPENKPVQSDDLATLSTSWNESDVWTSNEKDLLDRGLSLFGRSWPRLAQYVGTKTAHQVKSFVSSQSPSSFSEVGALGFTEIIDDFQIPASMEEVIAVISTAQPTVSSHNNGRLKAKRGRPLAAAKADRVKGKRGPKPKNRTIDEARPRGNPRGRPPKGVVLGPPKQNKVCAIGGEEVVRMVKTCDQDVDVDVDVEVDVESDSEEVAMDYCPFTNGIPDSGTTSNGTSSNGTTSNGTANGTSGTEDSARLPSEGLLVFEEDSFVREEEVVMEETVQTEEVAQDSCAEEEDVGPLHLSNHLHRLSDGQQLRLTEQHLTEQQQRMKTHQAILERVYDLPTPVAEHRPDPFAVSQQEREIHAEFFEGRAAKTPSRYLKIRNHIVECWRTSKPVYVSKTSVRTGLKNCGDVNCIGRIHAYLEQTGAINFGCDQTRYERPTFAPSPYDPLPAPCHHHPHPGGGKPRVARKPRPWPSHSAPSAVPARPHVFASQHGGYTITHRPDGSTQTHVVVEPPARRRINNNNNNGGTAGQPIQLICCKKFDETNQATYAVELDVSALVVMDVHAHASHCEVIGLLGGTTRHDAGGTAPHDTLLVTRTVPCRAASSQVHCDMCPVSQTEASEQLMAEGCDVIGWYHSHPTFSPNPSLQDIVTQRNMQEFFRDRPFLGIILSPHTMASTYRCIVVVSDDGAPGEGKVTPYRHNVRLVARRIDTASLRSHLRAVFDGLGEHNRFGEVVNPQLSITYLDKCIESVTHHLGRLSQLTSRDKQTIAGVIRDLAQDYAS